MIVLRLICNMIASTFPASDNEEGVKADEQRNGHLKARVSFQNIELRSHNQHAFWLISPGVKMNPRDTERSTRSIYLSYVHLFIYLLIV